MRLKAPRLGELLAGVAGCVLLVSLFLPWYSDGELPMSGFEAFAVLDIVLVLLAGLGIVLMLAEMTQPTSAVPTAISALLALFGVVVVIWAAISLIAPPGADLDREWVLAGVAAALLCTIGGFISGRDEGTDFWPGQEPLSGGRGSGDR